MHRTHTCGELRRAHEGQTVTLSGWVNSYREQGKELVFVDLRDRYGKTQVVFRTDDSAEIDSRSRRLRREDVVQVVGKVHYRGDGLANAKLETGEIEVRVEQLTIFSQSKTPPFELDGDLPNEELRLKHRFLDLRRASLQRNIIQRHHICQAVRRYFNERDFLEIETPILGRSTPEGARDYLVPSRIQHGTFYALPQSPQIYKQILMVSGFDRYYQIARCFRDENLRADRPAGIHRSTWRVISFVQRDDILTVIDGLVSTVVEEIGDRSSGGTAAAHICRRDGTLRQRQARLRYGLELVDIGDVAAASDFSVFKAVVEGGGRVRGINVKGG
ncbi:MAG: amino acid--tRNA ligase-related protein [Planctomycetaceae bacterium]